MGGSFFICSNAKKIGRTAAKSNQALFVNWETGNEMRVFGMPVERARMVQVILMTVNVVNRTRYVFANVTVIA